MRLLAVAALALSPLPALAECPAAPDHSAAIAETLSRIQAADREMDARPLANELWTYWADAPDEVAQELLDTGMRARDSYDYLRAKNAFDRLVAYCPDMAIRLDPQHVAALSGKALTLMGLGQDDAAQEVLREALALNPWLSERHLLKEPPGEDI